MSKEIEAFSTIVSLLTNDRTGTVMGKKELLTLEQALTDYEAIKNAEPSEALKSLDRIDNTLCLNNIKGKLEFGIDTEEHTDCDSVIGMTDDLETIKQALIQKSKKEQVWDIVIKKNVDIWQLKKTNDLERYNFWVKAYWSNERKELTKEEFNTLKEVLGE